VQVVLPDRAVVRATTFNGPGMRMETWDVEFFDPVRPMFEAAPLVLIRGDHEIRRSAE